MISIITGASATGKTFKLQKELKEIYENHEVPVLVVNTFRESIYDDFKPIEIKDINKNLKCKLFQYYPIAEYLPEELIDIRNKARNMVLVIEGFDRYKLTFKQWAQFCVGVRSHGLSIILTTNSISNINAILMCNVNYIRAHSEIVSKEHLKKLKIHSVNKFFYIFYKYIIQDLYKHLPNSYYNWLIDCIDNSVYSHTSKLNTFVDKIEIHKSK